MKTAVEWLVEQLNQSIGLTKFVDNCDEDYISGILGIIEQAKEMEEEQIAKAFDCGYSNGEGGYQDNPIFHGCNYYTETFKSE